MIKSNWHEFAFEECIKCMRRKPIGRKFCRYPDCGNGLPQRNLSIVDEGRRMIEGCLASTMLKLKVAMSGGKKETAQIASTF